MRSLMTIFGRRNSMINILRQPVFVTALALTVSSLALAGNPTRTGTAGAQELLIPVGARGIALGQTSLMSAMGVDAIYWNPAGLARTTFGTEATFTFMQYFADIKQ